jgi:hypothetical protein
LIEFCEDINLKSGFDFIAASAEKILRWPFFMLARLPVIISPATPLLPLGW